MTKTLTEQWKEGTLENDYYYVHIKLDEHSEYDDIDRVDVLTRNFEFHYDDYIKEVLAPVPTYQEHLESESHCAVYSEINELNKQKIEELNAKCSQLEKKVKKRGMQINRAYDRYVAKRKESSEMVAKCNRLEELLKRCRDSVEFDKREALGGGADYQAKILSALLKEIDEELR